MASILQLLLLSQYLHSIRSVNTWINYPPNPLLQYYYSNTCRSWSDSVSFCTSIGGELASAQYSAQRDFIVNSVYDGTNSIGSSCTNWPNSANGVYIGGYIDTSSGIDHVDWFDSSTTKLFESGNLIDWDTNENEPDHLTTHTVMGFSTYSLQWHSTYPGDINICICQRILTSQPTKLPTIPPTLHPSNQPSSQPSLQPSSQPSSQPTPQPSTHPTHQPSPHPTPQPTVYPTYNPSKYPTTQPTLQHLTSSPTVIHVPTNNPTSKYLNPTVYPSTTPYTSHPSTEPQTTTFKLSRSNTVTIQTVQNQPNEIGMMNDEYNGITSKLIIVALILVLICFCCVSLVVDQHRRRKRQKRLEYIQRTISKSLPAQVSSGGITQCTDGDYIVHTDTDSNDEIDKNDPKNISKITPKFIELCVETKGKPEIVDNNYNVDYYNEYYNEGVGTKI